VEPGSAAEKAGLMVGDLLIALDQKPTIEPEDVQSALGPDSVGKTLTAHVVRGGTLIELPVTVGERGLE
jgi:S1-C subfamily serine protease